MSQKKYSLLYPDTNAQYRTLSDVTMHDLGMDQICKKLSAKEREQNYIQNVMARMYADPAVTQYRCDIFEDVLQQKKMRDDLMEILERISFLREYGSFNREYDESACIWDLLHRLDELNDYIKCVDAIHTCLAASDIHSAGFLGLKAYVEKIYADNGFAELKKDISELKMDTSQLKSITVGINLNDRFEADGIGLISVNSKYFTKSGILGNFYDHIASKDRINEDTIWKKNFKFQPFDVNADAVISTHMQKVMDTAVMRSESRGGIVKLPEGDQAKDVTRYTDRIVNHMISHMVKRVREVLNKYVSITITDMTDLIPELLYYIKWAEYIQKLQEQGFTFAKASVYKEGENESDPYMMQARGIYNVLVWPMIHELFEPGGVDRVTSDIRNAGPWGFLILLAIQFLQIVVAFIPGEVVQVAAGMIYGPWVGALIIWLGCIISSSFIFVLVHKLGAPFVQAMVPEKYMGKFRDWETSDKFNVIVFILFLIPGLPKDVFTYITPLTHMSMKNFVLISNFARIPGIVLSTYAAAGLVSGNIVESVIIFAVTAAVAIVALVVYGRVTKKSNGSEK